jgi:hypothetical protein
MAFIEYNPNPMGRKVGDCSVRAIAKALNMDWASAYMLLTVQGMCAKDMPSSDAVWGASLRQHGFKKYLLPDTCPECYTVQDFCSDHPEGTYVLALGGHVVTVINGNFYDSWDSSDEVPLYYWSRKEGNYV